MEPSGRPGSTVFGLGMIGFGALVAVYRDTAAGLEPVAATMPGRAAVVWGTAAVLVAGGAAILVPSQARRGAMAIGALLLSWLVLLHAPALIRAPQRGDLWVTAFETVALCAAAWLLVDASPRGIGVGRDVVGRVAPVATAAFGLSFLVFGASHFVYRDYVASVIPAWLPAHYFWAYATGVAHLAAGVALLTRIRARLAAMALTVMFGTWVVILHLPRVVANPTNRAEWTSLVVALACCGASWIVAGRLAAAPRPIATGDDRRRRVALEPSR